MKFSSDHYRRGVVCAFFSLLLCVGLWLYKDYGISADEPNNHLNGLVQIKYVAQLIAPALVERQASASQIPNIRAFADADHGPAFEIPLALLSLVFTHGDARAFYWLRHLCTFLLFVAGTYALYRLVTWRLQSWRWGLLAATLLILSPRFFGEAFYNGKDIVFLALFTISVFSLLHLALRPNVPRTLLHAFSTACAVDVRVHGVLLVLLSLLLLVGAVGLNGRFWRIAGLYVGATCGLVVLGWPYLWAHSSTELWQAAARASHYPWQGAVLYLGHVYRLPAERLPWHYVVGWIAVTTPIFYTVAALAGVGLNIYTLLNRRAFSLQRYFDLVVLLWLIGPLGFVIVRHSSVYNGWRHLYFVYPAFLLLATRTIYVVWAAARGQSNFRLLARLCLLTGALEAGHTLWYLITAHPFQYTYFSFLPPQKAEQLFEIDYWGLSYRQGLQWIVDHDPSPQITISGNAGYIDHNLLLLDPAQRARLHYIGNPRDAEGPTDARYFLSAYYYYGGHRQHYPDSLGQEVHTIRANGLRVLSVFRHK